jgi:hypothetical protein
MKTRKTSAPDGELRMTRATRIATLLMIVLSLTTFAQHNSASRVKPDGTKSMEGKIVEINATKLLLANEHGAQREFKLSDKTKFRLLNKKNVKLDAIATGQWVRVTFREADQTVTLVQETVKRFTD